MWLTALKLYEDKKLFGHGPNTFRKECIKAAELLPDNLAIPVSGGDSEIVARSVHALGKQATIYYEDYPWVSSTYKDMSKKVAEELNYEWIDYTADYDQCIERMKKYNFHFDYLNNKQSLFQFLI